MAIDLSKEDSDRVWALIQRPKVREVVLSNLGKSRLDQIRRVREAANLTDQSCDNPLGVVDWIIDLVISGA